jgi:hypothetical protein
MNFNVIPLILSIIQGCNPNRRVFICFENAGSTKPLFKEYMLKAVGVQVEGSKVINSKRWTQVSRNRLFITNTDTPLGKRMDHWMDCKQGLLWDHQVRTHQPRPVAPY